MCSNRKRGSCFCIRTWWRPRGAPSQNSMRTARYSNASRLVPPGTSMKDGLKQPDATIATHSSGLCTIGTAMQNDARRRSADQLWMWEYFHRRMTWMTISKEILFSDEQDLFCSYSRFFLCLLDCFNMTIINCWIDNCHNSWYNSPDLSNLLFYKNFGLLMKKVVSLLPPKHSHPRATR